MERLESKRDREAAAVPRRTGRVVTFTREEVRPGSVSTRHTEGRRLSNRELEVEDLEREERDGEYVVDPAPLNGSLRSRLDCDDVLLDGPYGTAGRFSGCKVEGEGPSSTSYRAGPLSAGSDHLTGRRENRPLDAQVRYVLGEGCFSCIEETKRESC